MYIIDEKTDGEAYHKLITALLYYGQSIDNTLELQNLSMHIRNPNPYRLTIHDRNVSEKYLNAELEWYWSGNNSAEWIGQYAKKWLSITDDGKTSNSAYGYIILKKYKNQLEEIIQLLYHDPLSRRAVLNISDPRIDRIETKDMQCTIMVQFLLRNDKINTTVCMRSNDIYTGFPYDYVFFMSLAEYIRQRLNCDNTHHLEIGTYTHNVTSMHIYSSCLTKLIPPTSWNIDKIINIDLQKYYKLYEEWYENKNT